jgi:hypothetical protein
MSKVYQPLFTRRGASISKYKNIGALSTSRCKPYTPRKAANQHREIAADLHHNCDVSCNSTRFSRSSSGVDLE